MIESFFILKSKLTYKLSELVIDGSHIVVDSLTFEKLSSRPYGRRLYRKLQNGTERFILYK